MVMVLIIAGCVKETYDMNKLSSKVHLSPAIVLGAINGDISLIDMVDPNDTLVFDQDNLVKIIIKEDSVIDLKFSDFNSFKNFVELKGDDKGLGQMLANIEPETLDIDIEDVLSRITGDFIIPNPTIKLYYANSFPFPIKLKLDATGKRNDKTPVDLGRDTLILSVTNPPDQPNIMDSLTIDNTNSSLADIISLPPEEIIFFGTALLDTLAKKDKKASYLIRTGRIIGNMEIEIPIEFGMNLLFADTLDNFLSDAFDDDSDFSWDDFDSFQMDFNVDNGFPVGVSLTMVLYDSLTQSNISSVDADDLLDAAPVDNFGRATGSTLSSTSVVFTHDFFNSIKMADKVILNFALNSTDNEVVKIYTDYRIKFDASFIFKPNINIDLK